MNDRRLNPFTLKQPKVKEICKKLNLKSKKKRNNLRRSNTSFRRKDCILPMSADCWKMTVNADGWIRCATLNLKKIASFNTFLEGTYPEEHGARYY